MRFVAGLLAFAFLGGIAQSQLAPSPLNDLILHQITKMPSGGKYSASRTATLRLQAAAHFESGIFSVLPASASPSYCSGATLTALLST